MLDLKEKEEKLVINKKSTVNPMKYKSNIWKSYLYHFLIGGHLISGVITVFFMTWGKLSFIEIMFLQAYFWLAILFFEIPCGAISDYIGRKYSLFLGGFSLAMAAFIYTLIPHIAIFLIGETLWALGEASISGTNSAIVFDTLKLIGREKEIDKIVARNVSFLVAGIGISAPIGSLLTLLIPIQFVETLMFVPFSLAAIVSLMLKEPNHDLEKSSSHQSYLSIIKSGIKELKRNKKLLALGLDQMIGEGLIFLVFWMYQPYLEGFGVPLVYFGFVAALMTICQVIFMNLVPKLNDRIVRKKSFLFTFTVITGILFILLGILRSILLIIVLFGFVVGVGISRSIIHVRGINTQIESENRATVLSTINMIGTGIKTVIFPITGYLVMASLSTTFVVIGIVMLLLAILSRVKNDYLS
ncbi:MAG: MFS transporter [Candidatus Lokiarchaeota archaeon]|nr:MFS transporter [Candidatus Lokiarchaeota archaeon]